MQTDKHIALAVPLVDQQVHAAFAFSFIPVAVSTRCAHLSIITPRWPAGYVRDVAEARNNICKQALGLGCDYVVQMDTDQIYPPDTVNKLIAHDLDIVGVRVHRRHAPFEPIANRGKLGELVHVPDDECFSGEVIEVDATGTGCLCVKTEVLKNLDYPWFVFGQNNGKTVGEDIGFCFAAAAAGYKVHVDTSVEVQHMATIRIDSDVYRMYREFQTFNIEDKLLEMGD